MAIETKGKYNVALDGQGFILQGVPDRPAYVSAQAPVYGTRFASGDRDYNDLSQWWYLIQTDWSGGMKDTLSFEDDAEFYYGSNVDVYSRPGSVRLARDLVLYDDYTADGLDEITSYQKVVVGTSEYDLLLSNGQEATNMTASDVFATMGVASQVFGHRGNLWLIGSSNYYGSGAFPIAGTSVTSQINSVIDGSVDMIGAHVVVGTTLYLFGISTVDTVFCVKTTVAAPASSADWTLVFETSLRGQSGPSVVGAGQIGDEILVLVEGSPVWSLWSLSVSSGVATHMKDFAGQQLGIYIQGSRYITRFTDGQLLITILEDDAIGKGSVWKYDGTSLTRIYSSDEVKQGFAPTTYEATAFLRGGSVLHKDNAYWGNLVYDGEHFFPFVKKLTDDLQYPAIPIGSDGDVLYMVDLEENVNLDDQYAVYTYDDTSAFYKTSGFVVMSHHDKLQSIDKLMHNVNIGFNPLATGEEIEVYYSTAPSPSPAIGEWTLLGEATYAADGGSVTYKVLPFGEGINPKKIWFRIQLKSSTTNTTPSLTDFTLEYLPIPDYRRQWVLNINAGDDILRLDGANETRTGREMAGFLENLWLKKEVFDYQDLEYAGTQLNGAINSSVTTIPVDDTSNFPEYGRLLIGSEEVFYTGKTPKSFTGCLRGRQGTVAASHADNLAVNTGLFKALITNYQRTVPILQRDKDVESVIQLSLRETGT